MPNMVCKVVGKLAIAVNNTKPPTEEDWWKLIDEMKKLDIEETCFMALTEGGAPNAAQRRLLNEVLQGKSRPTAIVSQSSLVRGVVTALGWFNSRIKVYSPTELDEALRWLGLSQVEAYMARAEIRTLRAKLGVDAGASLVI